MRGVYKTTMFDGAAVFGAVFTSRMRFAKQSAASWRRLKRGAAVIEMIEVLPTRQGIVALLNRHAAGGMADLAEQVRVVPHPRYKPKEESDE